MTYRGNERRMPDRHLHHTTRGVDSMPAAVKRIREWFDMRSRLKKAELAVQYDALRRESSVLLEHADSVFAILPKAIPMSEILVWRANYRELIRCLWRPQ